MYAGALVVVLLVGNWPVDRFGRKPALWAVQVFMVIAALIEIFATNWTHWLVTKIPNVKTYHWQQKGYLARLINARGSLSVATK